MKYSIRKKLILSGLIMLLLIILMIAGSQIIVGFFKNTTENLIIEYNELHAIQEFKMSLSNLLIFANGISDGERSGSKADLKSLVKKSQDKLEVCKQVLTFSHKLSLLTEFESMMNNVDSAVNKLYQVSEEEKRSIKRLILSETTDGIRKVDTMVNETKVEIEEYENRNRTVILHGTFSMVLFGLVIILIISFGGMKFIRNLTNPIKELVTTTQKISKGDRRAKVRVDSTDEFLTLAESFNEMVDTLDKTTVSKDYLNNIINNMFDALVVTDKDCIIRSTNNASLKLLGYKESELLNKDIMLMFTKNIPHDPANPSNESILNTYRRFINKQNYFISKKGKLIPALITCTLLKNQKNESEGLIMVGHDLTEKKAYEEKLEQNRKERLISINEAQEEERIRIAIDLHDGIGQMLTAISYSIQELNIPDKGDPSTVLKIQNQIDLTLQETKNLAHNLIPIVLKDFGLIAAIENLIMKANEMYDANFRFNHYDYKGRIDTKLEKALYRICQESLTNIVKHAKAKNADFQLFRSNNIIVLVIDDDGIGFDLKSLESDTKKTSIGLISIRERVMSFDGAFTIDSQPGKGTELIIEIPCRKK
ncbi:MAG: PAS domain-containing protein [Bacteroidales bacterium]|nr:PAS domain-containing protein [Bacteroidales bacterium]